MIPEKKKTNIAIGIITYKRKQKLVRLLESIVRIELLHSWDLTVILCDNDESESSKDILKRFYGLDEFHLQYIVEQKKGIPNARNRVLKYAIKNNFRFLAFVDDDETVHKDWLLKLVSFSEKRMCHIVFGKVEIVSDNRMSYSDFYGVKKIINGSEVRYGFTTNVLMQLDTLKKNNLFFDERFQSGSDCAFFFQMNKYKIDKRYCSDAITYEYIQGDRLSGKWFFQRSYRFGNTLSRVEVIYGNNFDIVFRIIKASGHIFIGLISFFLPNNWNQRNFSKNLGRIIRGIGMLTGLIGIVYDEYN